MRIKEREGLYSFVAKRCYISKDKFILENK
jgi:hypothetical protein